MKNVMMHVINFLWRGGVPMFVRDVMKVYPEFHHVVCYFSDNYGTDAEMTDDWQQNFGTEVCQIPKLSKVVIEEIDPVVLMLHNTGGRNLEGRWPYYWLRERPLIFVHHNTTSPVLLADLDMFVSEIVRRKFGTAVKEMKRPVTCPPVIDTSLYESIPRSPIPSKRCVVGKVCSAWNKKKYPELLWDIMKDVAKRHEKVSFTVVGADKHTTVEATGVPRLKFVPEMSVPVPQLLRGLDIFLYVNAPDLMESWCRAVTEAMSAGLPVVAEDHGGIAEQIEDQVTGFLCRNREEYVASLERLILDSGLRYEVGMRAREAAKAHGLDRLRRETVDVVLAAAVGAV